jgi:hypothetical protein
MERSPQHVAASSGFIVVSNPIKSDESMQPTQILEVWNESGPSSPLANAKAAGILGLMGGDYVLVGPLFLYMIHRLALSGFYLLKKGQYIRLFAVVTFICTIIYPSFSSASPVVVSDSEAGRRTAELSVMANRARMQRWPYDIAIMFPESIVVQFLLLQTLNSNVND